ncbi:MAG TPA: 4-hydroxy-3-methylbut-2-enyl diphosphate reductase [Ferruginibacter sp.]|nr:4-hydroxy-3-methylbut-2-enyl diphosphate reductase [Ferruginibacter sp.]
MKQFTIPFTYRSPLIAAIKNKRKQDDKMKKDFTPTLLDFGNVQVFLARHFGFCYGVENAIEIAFRIIEENPGKRIFLLSEIIHNPRVNEDLLKKGVRFLQDTSGKQLLPFEELNEKDIVIIPAFGTTLDIEKKLQSAGIVVEKYNTTCPFVEKVWNRSEQIAAGNYTVVIHGKPSHEETRATFSHASSNSPSIVVNDLDEAKLLAKFIEGEENIGLFEELFRGRYSINFDPVKDLQRIGVVNQTTMLAADTQEIADYLKWVITKKYGSPDNFADTRDTLCYATNDNQSAVYALLKVEAGLAIVVGGYNSSNTSHLVELCEEKLPTYFINDAEKILSRNEILHYNLHNKNEVLTTGYLPENGPLKVLITSGASCPDTEVEKVIEKIISFYNTQKTIDEMISLFP